MDSDTDEPVELLRWRFDLTGIRDLNDRAMNGDIEARDDMLHWVCIQGLSVSLIETVISLADEIDQYRDTEIAEDVWTRANEAATALIKQYRLDAALALAKKAREFSPDHDEAAVIELTNLMESGYLALLIETVTAQHELVRALVAALYSTNPQAADWLADRLPDLPHEPTAEELLHK
jgi:hypothetical protein